MNSMHTQKCPQFTGLNCDQGNKKYQNWSVPPYRENGSTSSPQGLLSHVFYAHSNLCPKKNYVCWYDVDESTLVGATLVYIQFIPIPFFL